MINATSDNVITLTQAAKICPKVDGKRPSTVTIWRWATKGVRGVMLEHVRVGRRIVTTEEAINTFFRDLSTVPAVKRVPLAKRPQEPTEKQREREISKARARLIARGMLPKETVH